MPITTNDRFFGEGLPNTGAPDAREAFRQHRRHVRIQRLSDLLGKDPNLSNSSIAERFDEIAAAIKAADEQVAQDNATFMKEHGITA